MLTKRDLELAAAAAGFEIEPYEKVHKLVQVLDAIRSHRYLGPRVALKGGTALNLFLLALPRLSVDIDLNYIGSAERQTMLEERPHTHQALEQVGRQLGLTVKRAPTEHAGGKWRFSYGTLLGRPGIIEVDMNFLLRTPLWPVAPRTSRDVAGSVVRDFPVLDSHELVAGKLAAALARQASRDLFDIRQMMPGHDLDLEQLRLSFIVYGGANRVDWRRVSEEAITASEKEVEAQLVPMLRATERPARGEVSRWAHNLMEDARVRVASLFPLRDREREFLEQLNGHGRMLPELLTSDVGLQHRLREHPALQWKALNVQRTLQRKGRGRGR